MIIGIMGKARAGKDTLADLMKEELERKDKSVIILRFADLLKWIAEKEYGWDGSKDEKGRDLLIQASKDIKAEDDNFFLDYVMMLIKVLYFNMDFVIITDVRYKIEYDRIKTTKNYKFIRIRGLNQLNLDDESETQLDNHSVDLYVNNFGTMNDLKIRAKYLVEEVL